MAGLDDNERNDAEVVNDDRRADIEAAFEKHQEEREPAPETPAVEATPEEKVDRRKLRERDESGRYKPKGRGPGAASRPRAGRASPRLPSSRRRRLRPRPCPRPTRWRTSRPASSRECSRSGRLSHGR